MFGRVADHRGRIEIALGIFQRQHKRWQPGAHQQIADDQRATAVVAFDEQLRLAEDAHIHTGRTLPHRFTAIRAVPIEQVLDTAFNVVEEVLLGGGQVLRVFHAARRVATAEHRGVDLQHQVQMMKVKQVNAPCDIVVNQRIAFKHVVQHFVGQGVARLGKLRAELGKAALHFAERAFNR